MPTASGCCSMKQERSRVAGNRPKLESGKTMSAERPPTNRPWRGARDSAHARLLVAVAVVAAGVGVTGLLTEAWGSIENASVDARFSLRPDKHPQNVVVVGIDNKTLN